MRKSKLFKYRKEFRFLFWLALLTIYIAAVLPGDIAPVIGSLSDKGHHVLAFVVLGVLLRFAYRVNYWQGILWLLLYGILIEFSQLFAIHRSAEFNDILADLVGSFIGLRLYRYIVKVLG